MEHSYVQYPFCDFHSFFFCPLSLLQSPITSLIPVLCHPICFYKSSQVMVPLTECDTASSLFPDRRGVTPVIVVHTPGASS